MPTLFPPTLPTSRLNPSAPLLIYDSLELFSYTREIASLNKFLMLHGHVETNSRIHSRVTIASNHQVRNKKGVEEKGVDCASYFLQETGDWGTRAQRPDPL